jgi:hypothetical protein
MSSDVNLFVSRFPTLPRVFVHDYAGTNTGTTPEAIAIDDLTVPVPIAPGRWYLGVATAGTNSASYSIVAAEFAGSITTLTNDSSVTVTNTVTGGTQYYVVDVPEIATAATFTGLASVGDIGLYLRRGLPLPGPGSFDVAGATQPDGSDVIRLTTSSAPVALIPGRYYLAVQDEGAVPSVYTLNLVLLFDRNDIESLFDDVPVVRQYNGASTSLFRFNVDPDVPMILFEIYGLTGPAELTVSKGGVPGPLTRNFSNPRPDSRSELILITTNDFLDLSGPWFLSVGGVGGTPAIFTIRAAMIRDGNPFSRAPYFLSIFPGTELTPVGRIAFDTIPTLTYQLQYATNLGAVDPWQDLGSPIVADDARYYRVIQVTNP